MRFQLTHTVVGMGAFQLIAFATGLLVARGLGPAGLGRFQLFVSMSVFLVALAQLGLDEGVAYLIPRYQRDAPRRVRGLALYALGLAACSGLVLGCLVFALAGQLETHLFQIPGFAADLRWAPLAFPALASLLMGIAILRGLGHADLRAFIYYYGVGLFFLTAAGILCVVGMTVELALAARVASYALGGLVALVWIRRFLPRGGTDGAGSLQRADVRRIHGFSNWLMFAGLFQYLISQPLVDLILVGRFARPDEVGVYAVGARLAILLAILPNAVTTVLAPGLARYSAADEHDALVSRYRKASTLLAHTSVLAAAGLLAFRAELLALFGPDFAAGSKVMAILIGGYLLHAMLGINAPTLIAKGHGRLDFILAAAALALMVLGGLALGSWFGSVGIAWATAASLGLLAATRLGSCAWFVTGAGPGWLQTVVPATAVSGGLALALQRGLPELPVVAALLVFATFALSYVAILRYGFGQSWSALRAGLT